MKSVKMAMFGALFCAAAAHAHHSYAMFNQNKEISADATVRLWEFTNPHAKLWVYINDDKGTPVLWALEAVGPQQLLASGWDRDTVKPGDKIKVVLNPLNDGRAGGSLKSLTLADGRKLGMGGPPPPGAAAGAGPNAPAAPGGAK